MKIFIYLLSVSLVLSVFIPGCSTDTNAEYGDFSVEILNTGTTDITDFELSMIGAEGSITIKKLEAGQSSGYRIFTLPKIEGERPDSWGDYSGLFTQKGTVKDVFVLNYEHNFRPKMSVEINDQTYITRFPL